MAHSPLYCTSCGTANQPPASFCFACGRSMQSAINTLTGLLATNHLLKHRYCVISQVGRGGMGAVYKAEDTLFSNQLVAVKEMSQSGLSPQEIIEAVDAFKREAHMLASLNHSSLPKIQDYFNDAGRWYLVMDFIAGETLEAYLNKAQGGTLPVKEVIDIGSQLCTVLDYLHTRQPTIIFRDLKPANIMRTPNGHLYLIDFGIARHFKPGQSKDTTAFGTLGYAAPELLGKQTTPQSDIYSLGATLHQLLTGHNPSSNTPTPFHFPSLQVPSQVIPTELKTLIEQMLEINPSNRPATMTAIKKKLQDMAAQPPGKTPLVPTQPTPIPQQKPVSLAQQPAVAKQHVQPQQVVPKPIVAPRQVVLPSSLTPAKHGISWRTVVLILAVLAIVVVVGGRIALLTNTQLPHYPTPTAVPNSAITSVDFPMFGYDLAHTHFNPDEHILSPTNVSRLVPLWSASTGDKIYSSPAVANGVVYVGSYDTKLYAFVAATGKPLWNVSTGGLINSSPAVANGVVYVGSDDSKLYAFNATTGKPLWSAATGDRIDSSPAVANGVVYVGSFDELYAFEAGTGKPLWSAATSGPISSSPAVANGVVYIGSRDSNLHAFVAVTGKFLWSAATSGPISSSPAVANGVVYVGSEDGKLYAFEAATGKSLWSAATSAAITSSPAVANGVVYVGSYDKKLYAFEASTGKPLWSAPTGDRIGASPAVASGVVYVGSDDSKLYAFHLL